MTILFLTNNAVSKPLSDWLSTRDKVIIWSEKLSIENITNIQPNVVVSYSYSHILKVEELNSLPNRIINLHISLLPYNRGADPNAWSFLENTPKGVSIHLIDPGVDTGELLVQKEVVFDENTETLAHSYQVLQEEIQSLFRDNWDDIKYWKIKGVAQAGKGTFHYARDFAMIKNRLLGEEGWDVPISYFKERYRQLLNGRGMLEIDGSVGLASDLT